MTLLEARPPELSWVILHGMMANAAGRSEVWRQTGSWALDVLEAELGGEWPLSAIETRARLVAVRMDPPPLRQPGVAIDIVPQARLPERGLRGPEMRGDSWARIAPRIRQKVEAAVESGADWLRLDAREGLWQFTEWATRPLAEKVQAFEVAVRGLLGGLDGIVVSCGPLLAQGAFDDEDVVLGPKLVALRCRLPFVRVRETLIIAADGGAPQAAASWVQFYSDESSWLDWALRRTGLPPTSEILAH